MTSYTKCSEIIWIQIEYNSEVNDEFSTAPNGISRSDTES